MQNTSLAAQAVAAGPMTAAPPSFEGHGWLVVINLAVFTAAFLIASRMTFEQIGHLWRCRLKDGLTHPVTLWRTFGMLMFAGLTVRSLGAAMVLWAWDPGNPAGTGWMLTIQRFLDPLALMLSLAGCALFVLSSRGMVDQLRRKPPPIRMWLSWPELRRPVFLTVASVGAAVAVVSLR